MAEKRDNFTPKPELPKGRYEHYSGKEYEVIDVVCDSETLEWRVIYKRLYDSDSPELWVRPYEMFVEDVTINGVTRPRFELLDKTTK